MLNSLLIGLFHLLAWMFLIGMAGCLLVIPIAAYQLFGVLLEKDPPDEQSPQVPIKLVTR
jgi:hypothetical protein